MNAEVKIAAAPQQAAPEKAKKPSVVDTFLKGCAKGFKVGIENITPAMILGYVLVYILQVNRTHGPSRHGYESSDGAVRPAG